MSKKADYQKKKRDSESWHGKAASSTISLRGGRRQQAGRAKGIEVKFIAGVKPWKVMRVIGEQHNIEAEFEREADADCEARRLLGIVDTTDKDAVWSRK